MKLLLGIIFLSPSMLFACTGGTLSGSITPTSTFQTQSVLDGEYYTMSVVCGTTYTFTFCNNGGSSGALFPEITILDAAGVTELGFSPYVNACSELIWTASFTGNVQVLITDSGCLSGLTYNGTMAYQAVSGASTFTYTPICEGSNATVSSTGGVFSWNPSDPGDGAVLNTSTGNITNGVGGATYTVDYTLCGSPITQSTMIPLGDCWTLNGDATYVNIGGEQCIQLTPGTNNQTGCAWNGSQIDFSLPFTLSLDYYFGNNINGADGNTFTFQPSSSAVCGTNGGQLRAGNIPNALSIEFDTYDNDNPAHIYDMACDHIALEIDGNMQGPGAPLCGPVCAKIAGGNIDDGGTYPVDISWNPATQVLDVYFNGVLRLSCTHDFITNVFGTNSVYWGVTGATGGLNNQQYFCPSSIIILPTEMSSFSSSCNGDVELIEWETASEIHASHYTLESTSDGIVFEPIATVKANGNTQSASFYRVELETQPKLQRLFRLKMVDDDGTYEHSGLILSKACGRNESNLISDVSTTTNNIKIGLNERATCTLHNQLGQLIFKHVNAEDEILITTNIFSSGIYILRADNGKGKMEIKRIFVE